MSEPASTPAQAAGTALRFDRPVSHREVHKQGVEEVLVTDSVARPDGGFACAAHLPRSHRTHAPAGADHHDLLLLNEAFRQATILGAHRHLGVPFGRVFLGSEGGIEITDPAACRRRPTPSRALIEVTVHDRREIDGVLTQCELQARIHVDGMRAAMAIVRPMYLTVDEYRALRADATTISAVSPPPLDRATAADVGRREQCEVMVSAIERPHTGDASATIAVDLAHPSFFDHPLDHVPASLLAEAARQVAHAALGGLDAAVTAVGLQARFQAFAELGSALVCEATIVDPTGDDHGRRRVTAMIRQLGNEIAELNLAFIADEAT